MAVVPDGPGLPRPAPGVDATDTPAPADARTSGIVAHEIDDLIAAAHGVRQAWDAFKAMERARTTRPGLVSENAAGQELDILMLELVYRVERVRALGYGAGLLGQEPDGSIEERLLAHLAAHRDSPKARHPSTHSDAPASVIEVWRFGDAAEHYRLQFDDADEDDWLVHVPKAQVRSFIPWLAGPELCGYFGVTTRTLPDGSELRVAHARYHAAYR